MAQSSTKYSHPSSFWLRTCTPRGYPLLRVPQILHLVPITFGTKDTQDLYRAGNFIASQVFDASRPALAVTDSWSYVPGWGYGVYTADWRSKR